MKTKINVNSVRKPDIEYLVLKNFIAVMKNNGMYPMFRCSVGWNTKNVVSNMYRHMNSFGGIMRNQSKENIYKDAGDMRTFVDMMKQSLNGGHRFSEGDPAQTQHYIANCVNMLLHVFVERNIRDFHKLESLGGNIFELTCREVFGNDFQDMLTPPENIERMRELNEMMMRGEKPSPEFMEQLHREMEEIQRRRQAEGNAEGLPMIEDLGNFLDEFLDEDNGEYDDEPMDFMDMAEPELEDDMEFDDEEDEDFDLPDWDN
jgi:hypothetical protein